MAVRWVYLSRKAHRWLGLIVGIQLLMWTGSGLFFSCNPIGAVRGSTEVATPNGLSERTFASPSPALASLRKKHPSAQITGVALRPLADGTAVYQVSYRIGAKANSQLVDAESGALRDGLSEDEAKALAVADFAPASHVKSVRLITQVGSGSEYRGKALPAYQVTFAHDLGTRIYVAVNEARVTARRNDRWRWFDFFWMLHVMDYQGRDDFNHLLLQALSILGLVTVASGFLLAWFTRKRRRPAADAGAQG